MLTASAPQALRVVGGGDAERQHLGHPPGGAQDRRSQAAVNAVLGRPPTSPVLECSGLPQRLQFALATTAVVGGAPGTLTLDGRSVAEYRRLELGAASVLELGAPERGWRRYVAVAGALRRDAGGRLRYDPVPALSPPLPPPPPSDCAPFQRLRLLPAPESTPDLLAALVAGTWRVRRDSDGMGLRLQGPVLPMTRTDIRSAPVCDGTIQATAAGPILLLRQRQTVGGYPRIAQLVAADLDLAAQLRPDAALHFVLA